MEDSLHALNDLGLNEGEIRLYKALVELGPSYLTALCKHAGVRRTSAYYGLEKLMTLGLMKVVAKPGKRKFYMAEAPHLLVGRYDEFLERKKEMRRELRESVTGLMREYREHAVVPRVSYCYGVEGVKKVMRDAFSGKYREVRNIMVLDEMLDLVGVKWFGQLMKEHIDHEVYAKVLRVANKMERNYEILSADPDPENKFRERRVLPRSISFTVTSWIYGNRVAYFSSRREGYAMIVESEELMQMWRALFDYLWSVSLPLSQYLGKFKR